MTDQPLPHSELPSPSRLRRFDQACDRFEAAWQQGERPRIEEYLAAVPEREHPLLLRELLALELAYCRQRHETLSLDHYRQRFPDHAPLVEAVFGEAGLQLERPRGRASAVQVLADTGPEQTLPAESDHPARLGRRPARAVQCAAADPRHYHGQGRAGDRGNQGGRPTGSLRKPPGSRPVEYAMSSPPNSGSLDARVRTMQIIGAALLMGVLTVLGAFVVMRMNNPPPPPPNPTVLYLAGLGFSAAILAGFFLVPRRGVAAVRARIARHPAPKASAEPTQDSLDAEALQFCAMYQTRLLVRGSMLNGTAMFWGIIFFITGQLGGLVAAAFLLILLAGQIPTRMRVERWLAEQQELLEQERQTAGL
jgi:hypothetical protein